MTESLVALLTAAIGAAVPLAAQLELRRRRRAGRLLTRASDRARVDRAEDRLWVGQELARPEPPENGHGDPRAP